MRCRHLYLEVLYTILVRLERAIGTVSTLHGLQIHNERIHQHGLFPAYVS